VNTPIWVYLAFLGALIMQHVEFRRRLRMKDRRIKELVDLLSQYRMGSRNIFDPEDVTGLLPDMLDGGTATSSQASEAGA
jgi:hypothetical protein